MLVEQFANNVEEQDDLEDNGMNRQIFDNPSKIYNKNNFRSRTGFR